jgi:hypothetical protein
MLGQILPSDPPQVDGDGPGICPETAILAVETGKVEPVR